MKKILLIVLILNVCKGWAQNCPQNLTFAITQSSTSICVGDAVDFHLTTNAPNTISVTWTFEDGSPAVSGLNISHQFNVANESSAVTASITVFNIESSSVLCVVTRLAFVSARVPFIEAIVSCDGPSGFSIRNSPFLSGGAISATWNFGDGTVITQTGSTIEHEFTQPGIYQVVANVTVSSSTYACTRTISTQVNIPGCELFRCQNRDFELGDYTNWRRRNVSTLSDGYVIKSGTGNDPYGGFPVVASGGNYSAKIGNGNNDNNQYQIEHLLEVTPENAFYAYRLAFVVETTSSQNISSLIPPSITFDILRDNEFSVKCSDLFFEASNTPGIQVSYYDNDVYYLPWTTYFIDLSDYIGETVEIEIEVRKGRYLDSDGDLINLFAYAYFDGYCTPPISNTDNKCIGTPIQFSADFETAFPEGTFSWNMGDGVILNNGKNVSHTYSIPGTYTVTLDYNMNLQDFPYGPVRGDNENCGSGKLTRTLVVNECASPFVCETCIPAFSPLAGQKYILTAWTKEGKDIGKHTYTHPSIRVNFAQGTITDHFRPSGLIIDGWQRIEGEFIVPNNATQVWIELHNDTSSVEIFFDDIKVQPFNSSMKSFVYDPVTLRMVAELDERHYATFYEYDEEGLLTRVKKETERGVKTIKENRESMRKRSNP